MPNFFLAKVTLIYFQQKKCKRILSGTFQANLTREITFKISSETDLSLAGNRYSFYTKFTVTHFRFRGTCEGDQGFSVIRFPYKFIQLCYKRFTFTKHAKTII